MGSFGSSCRYSLRLTSSAESLSISLLKSNRAVARPAYGIITQSRRLISNSHLSDRLLSLPEMSALMSRNHNKTRPDAESNPRIDRRCHPHLIDRSSSATAKCCHKTLLPVQEAIQHFFDSPAIGRLKRRRRLRAHTHGRFKYPAEAASPEVHPVGCIHLHLARTGSRIHLLPHGEISIRAQVQMLQAFG